MADSPSLGRTERKRQAVLAAATSLFLEHGFRGTSMDQIAARASVSKQTVYKQFHDKERLFREIVDSVTANARVVVEVVTTAFGPVPATTRETLEERLRQVARAYLDGVLQPHVLAVRRLVIAEAEQFPDLAAHYYREGPEQGVAAVAACLAPYVEAGLLDIDDLVVAATHFAYLSLGPIQDRAQFVPTETPPGAQRERAAAAAARTFLAAFGAER
ncbi:MAG: TetR/AcrR family transcriptional regulator [Nocardioidaceae bacterium]